MFSEPIRGRRRTLDRQKKQLVVNAVSRGATMTEAAIAVGVSLRTVQREAREDSHFDQALCIAHTDKAHPLDLMESAARTHWRAAAWLLERTNPEQYGRRSALSCSPFQFEEALKVVVEAALRLAPPENRSKVYACLTETSETVFKAVFPTCGPGSRRLVERLPDTPLGDHERMRRNTEPQFQRVIFEDERGRITESSLHEQPPRQPPEPAPVTVEEAPDPHAAPPLKPRAQPGGRLESPPDATSHSNPPTLPGDGQRTTVKARQETPGQRPGLQVSEQAAPVTPSDERGYSRLPAEGASPPPSAPEGRRHGARGASPWIKRATKSKPQRGDVAPDLPPTAPTPESPPPASRLSWRYLFRAARTNPQTPTAPISSGITQPPFLSPKTSFATKCNPSDKPPRHAPVSREAVAERGPEPEFHVNKSVVTTDPLASS